MSDKKKRPDYRKWANKYLKPGAGLPITSRPPNDTYRDNYDKINWNSDKRD